MSATTSRKLTLEDIADLRAYERERAEFRTAVIDLKARRRVGVGPFVTLLFENRDTIRFQVQEMARAERILTDAGIQHELDAYNPLIPEPGQLSATLFIELTSKLALMEWLPQLVGIERAVELRIGDGTVVRAVPEETHDEQLTRDDITSSVHYLRFELDPSAVAAVAAHGATLAVAHEAYEHATPLGDATLAELLTDLRP